MVDENEDWIDVGHVCHSLRRSRTRKMLYEILCERYPKRLSITELSALSWARPESVLGAMIGRDDRFASEDSLVSMGLALYEEEFVYGTLARTFQATRRGLDMKARLREYRYRSESRKPVTKEISEKSKCRPGGRS
jgi:predicted transcriptional regulator with HTH domain